MYVIKYITVTVTRSSQGHYGEVSQLKLHEIIDHFNAFQYFQRLAAEVAVDKGDSFRATFTTLVFLGSLGK